MSTPEARKIDESWILSNTDDADGDISWAEDTDPSDIDQQLRPKIRAFSRHNKIASLQNRVQQQPNTQVPEPEFIMPSIVERQRSQVSPVARHNPRIKHSDRSTRHTSRTISPQPPPRTQRVITASDRMTNMAIGTGDYLLDVVAYTLRALKQPLSWVLAAYMFAGLLVLVQNLLTSSITKAFSPICRIPGASYLHLPICRSPYTSPSQSTISSSATSPVNPEFDVLMTIQGKFETVLEDSAAGVSLPLDMKRSETSIRDLRQVVRFSSIPSKNELLHEFDGFVETARIVSYDLQKFNSHVGRAVDSVLSTARWTQRVLDDISHKTSQSSGVIADFINNRLLAPFHPLEFSESRLLDQYITHTRLISDEIESLVDEAQALLLVLTNLEDRLDIIHSISLRDNVAAKSSRDEILGQLWTFVGGNRAKLGQVDNQLRLLGRVGEYRKLAYAHVSGTILKLQAMGAELEELRTRVGSAELARDRGIMGVPLSVHIENIKLGVERLETQREKSREVERGHVRKVIDRGTERDVETRDAKLLVDAA